jgi:cytochrome c peroxidase
MRFTYKLVLGCSLLLAQAAYAHGPKPMPLQDVPVPPVPGLLDGPSPVVVDKAAAIALGKALFWDMNVGSDGVACGSCHFQAGADGRIKNQINPGEKSSQPSGTVFDTLGSGSGGPNHTLTAADFPLHKLANPLDNTSQVLLTTDDVVSSAGTFSGDFKGVTQSNDGNDNCDRSADPIFHIGTTGTRRVEPRNTPTVINVAFNYRNFWDGRANNIFNGSTPWGDRDQSAGVWVKTGLRSVVKQPLHLENSSLASLAMGPPLNPSEMSCRGRNLAALGRKLLLRKPLQNQKVHHQDSVFAPLNLTSSTASELKPGLNTTYKALITKAFNPKYWSYTGLGPFGAPALGQLPYNQAEANFSLFFGIALQMYESTLISDQAPIDLTPRGPNMIPTWQGMGKTPEEIASIKRGLDAFEGMHCLLCHAGSLMTTAAIETNAALVTKTPGKFFGPAHFRIPYGPNAFGLGYSAQYSNITPFGNVVNRLETVNGPKLVDVGFANTGVGDPVADPGIGGVDDFGNPLSFADQYVNYLLGNNSGIVDPGNVAKIRSCDFETDLAANDPELYPTKFSTPDGIQVDGSRGEGAIRTENCLYPSRIYIPTTAAADTSLTQAPEKLAVVKHAAFKIPSLRNVELTGPYMHNGSLASLQQVLEFYARHGNFYNPELNDFVQNIGLATSPENLATIPDIIALLKTFTDERVRYERAPFDHPEVIVRNGHVGDDEFVEAGNPLSPVYAKDELLVVPAVGANGRQDPLLPFDQRLAPAAQ